MGKQLTKLDSLKKSQFVEKYRSPEVMGNISLACEAIPISRQTYYNWLEEDEDFRTVIAEIKSTMVDTAEAELYSRGLEKDTTALIFWLKKNSERYRDTPQVMQQFNVGKDGNTITFVNFKDESKSQ